ncbi:MAG TPA: response regulator [Gemmatimonadales bacterium]|nr:response regulator [Gemmatimonadales bacterium]
MLRILLIEDDRPIRELLTRMLVAAGHHVTPASNGDEGLAVWRDQGADVVLTDIQMPGISGIEVMRQLRTAAPKLPIIAVSGGARSSDIDLLGKAGLVGTVGLLQKPFTGATLQAAITEALRQAESSSA